MKVNETLTKALQLFKNVSLEGRFCLSCLSYHASSDLLCSTCLKILPWIKHGCQRCALPLASSFDVCGACLNTFPDYLKLHALFAFQPPVSSLIHRLKYHHHIYWGRYFAELMAKRFISLEKPQALVPVPSAPERLQQRGFNPPMIIAKRLGELWGIPVLWKPFHRRPMTHAQAGLSKQKRIKNVQEVFNLKEALSFQHIGVIDDVVTTGSTLISFSKTLHASGVLKIDAFCVARTPKNP